ncbi:extracellular solute-binding protein [Cohnella candidum]|uniref:Extracellular solute-binding protein n=1 Tax=Cohnella candidum TaxID=2674991 RepID=A0A3G3JTU9_9BACL|nr:extracellular solute-binding protein [Cohnella candidum]AYQ71660.1 extracellular solute-binding protein [Cohnella candidum]
MNRKLALVISSVLALSTVLAACGGSNDKASQSPSASAPAASSASASPSESEPAKVEKFDISLRHIQVGQAQQFRKAILDEVVKRSEAEVPGANYEYDAVEDSVNRWTKLPAEMAAGNPPKIFDLFGGPGDGQKYAKAGKLLDVTPILDELGIKDKFTDVSTFVVDGKIYGLPIGASSEGLFYNTEIFSKYGINPPKTLDELEAAAETLKKNGITPFAMGSSAAWVPLMMVNTMMARYAGPDIQAGLGNGTHKWNEPEVVAAFAKYADWEKKGYFTKGELGIDYAGQTDQFITGKAGMLFDGTWRASSFKADGDAIGKALAGKVGYVAFPSVPNGKGDQTAVNYNQNNGYGFSADLNDNERAAVKAFIKNMYTDEFQIRGFKEDGVLPSMKVPADQLTSDDPVISKILDANKAATTVFPHFDSLVVSKVNGEVEKQIQLLIAGKATAQEVTDAIQKVSDAERAAAQ